MLNQSLKGMFKGEFTEVILTCIESSLPEGSNVTIVDVRSNPNYSGTDCIVLLDSEEHCNEISKNIANGYYSVNKGSNNGSKSTVLPLLFTNYKECDKDIKYNIKHIV